MVGQRWRTDPVYNNALCLHFRTDLKPGFEKKKWLGGALDMISVRCEVCSQALSLAEDLGSVARHTIDDWIQKARFMFQQKGVQNVRLVL